MTRERAILTAIWLLGFVACLVLVESYVHSESADGLAVLFAQDRMSIMKPLSALFGGHLTAILAAWFLRPFPAARSRRGARIRFRIALACTLVLVGTVLYYTAYFHLHGAGGGSVRENVQTAVKMGGLLSFLVAPVNVYYFGAKRAEAAEAG